VLGSLLVLGFPAVTGADSSGLRQSAQDLRAENAALAERSDSAVVGLYALESQLNAAQVRVDSLRSQIATVATERASVQRRLTLVRKVVAATQVNLGRRLVRIYEEGEPDALAIVLGAESIGEALSNLDPMSALTRQDRNQLQQARDARASLRRLTASLARREARLESLEQEAAAAADALDAARAERVRYLADLASQRRLNERQISSLERQGRRHRVRPARQHGNRPTHRTWDRRRRPHRDPVRHPYDDPRVRGRSGR